MAPHLFTRALASAGLTFLLLVALTATSPAPRADATLIVCPTNPSPPDPADPSIIVAEPRAADRLTSPFQVSGQARVFEANVRVTLYDATGTALVDTFTTAAEAGPALAPFAVDIAFTSGAEQAGCLRVFEESAADGSPRNLVQVEVVLAGSIAPPLTGTGGLLGERPGLPGQRLLLGIAAATALVITLAASIRSSRRA